MTSIIVPVYNIKNYLPRCIESLLAQSDPDFEGILVDDGSADGSGALCDAYAARDGRFRVMHKANGGLSSARNAGLDAARGEYILFLDGDDYLAPDAVQSLNAIAAAAGAFDFIQFRYAETDGSWQPGARQKPDVRICTDVREMFAYLYQAGGVAASACTKLYRAALFRGLRFREGIAHEDEQLLNSLGKENPFPNSFEVQVDNPERIKVITPSIGQLPKVETAKFGQEVVEHLFSLTKILRFGGIILVVFLAMATLFIISNTIRLTVFARRKEVVIMKYVGATDWFIRWPFLLEGMTLGFFGAVIASLCINSIYAGLLERIHATLAFLPLLPTSPLLFYVTMFLLAAGTGIGALGSYISLRKFLRV